MVKPRSMMPIQAIALTVVDSPMLTAGRDTVRTGKEAPGIAPGIVETQKSKLSVIHKRILAAREAHLLDKGAHTRFLRHVKDGASNGMFQQAFSYLGGFPKGSEVRLIDPKLIIH